MVYDFPGVKVSSSGAYYYSQDEVNSIKPELAEAEGNYILTREQLKSVFGITPENVGKVPEVLIAPRLNTTWSSRRSDETGENWWDITGEVVAYKPIAWVPRVTVLETIPKSELTTEMEMTTTTVEASKIYGSVTSTFEISAEGGMYGVKLKASAKAEAGVSYSISEETKKEVRAKGEFGKQPIKRIVLAMTLKVERMFEQGIQVYLNNKQKSWSLYWNGTGSWADLWVGTNSLRDVEALQYSGIEMSGHGYSGDLCMQILPVLDSDKKVTAIHTLLSLSSWTDWYVYREGTSNSNPDRREELPLPGISKPIMSLIVSD